MESLSVAVYLDFENLAISAETVYPSKDKPIDVEPIVDFASSKGSICFKRAYADWSKEIFFQYQSQLMDQGFELIHLPETNLQGKNGSDVRLAIDVIEHLHQFPNIKTLIIGSGDSDFIPLLQRIRAKSIEGIVIGFEHSVARLVKRNCSEFKVLEELLGEPEAGSPSLDIKVDTDIGYGRSLLLRYIRNRSEDGPILMAKLKQHLLRFDSSFSEKELGFASFKKFLSSMEGDLVEKIVGEEGTLPQVYLKEVEHPIDQKIDIKDTAGVFLNRKIRYQKNEPIRLKISQTLYKALNGSAPLSMSQMFEAVVHNHNGNIPRTEIKKYINTLFTGGAFKASSQQEFGPLLARPFKLKKTINNPEALDQVYIQRISEILKSRYPALKDEDILELLV